MDLIDTKVLEKKERDGGTCDCKRWTHNHNYERFNVQHIKLIRSKKVRYGRIRFLSSGVLFSGYKI